MQWHNDTKTNEKISVMFVCSKNTKKTTRTCKEYTQHNPKPRKFRSVFQAGICPKLISYLISALARAANRLPARQIPTDINLFPSARLELIPKKTEKILDNSLRQSIIMIIPFVQNEQWHKTIKPCKTPWAVMKNDDRTK